MSVVHCPKCSTIVPDNVQFCSMCGTFLSIQSEHPTLLTGLVDQDDVDTGATVLAEPAERAERAEDVSNSSMERGMMGLADESLTAAASNSMYATPRMHEEDDTPTQPGMSAQFNQPIARPAQPEPLQRERRQSGTIPATRLVLPQQSDLAPIHYPRSGAIDSRRHNQKSLLASSRYFLIGTGLLLFIGMIALVAYPYLIKGNTTMPAAYARPATAQTPPVVATSNPTMNPTSVVSPTPVATATIYSTSSLMPTPIVTAAPPPACLHVNMHGLSFNATVGGNAPAPQTITLSNSCTTAAWSVKWDAPWLSASPVYSGTVNGATPVVIHVASANLAAHSYTGHVVFSAGPSHTTVTVTLTIAPPITAIVACIKLDQNNLNFSAPAQQNPAPQSIMVTNCGSTGTVTATVSTSYVSQPLPSKQANNQPPMQHNNGTNWLTTSPGSQLAAGNTLPMQVNVTTLGPGVYTSSIAITITTSDGKMDTHTVNITFTVQGAQV